MQETTVAPQAGAKTDRAANAHNGFAKANALRLSGRLNEAEAILEGVNREFPEYVGVLMSLGQIQVARQQYGRALPMFIKAAMLSPHDWTILANLGHLYTMMGAIELAARTLEQAAAIAPDEPEIMFARAIVYSEQQEFQEAVDVLRRVLEIAPDHNGAAYHLGNCCMAIGRLREAADALTTATESPEFGNSALYSLSQLPPSVVSVDILAMAEKIENDPNSPPDEEVRIRLQFTRATALHHRKSHDEAWRILVEANAAVAGKRRGSQQQRHEEQKRYLALASNGSGGPQAGSSPGDSRDPASLFILGPSCSGKSTLERLFDDVPGIKLGYESHLADYAARQVCQIAGLLGTKYLAELPPHLDDRFREFYSDALRRKCGGARMFTNTNPGNIVNVGRLYALVSGARFIFVGRDALDTAFRMFLKSYRFQKNSYAYDLRWIRDHLDWYADMTDAWSARFPDACLRLTYEEMVVDPKATMARVAEFCGMDIAGVAAVEIGDDRHCAAPYADRLRPIFGD